MQAEGDGYRNEGSKINKQTDITNGDNLSTFSAANEKQLEVVENVNTYEDEDIDIQVVNELALNKDDRTLPCFTLRVFVTGIALASLSSSVYQLMVFKPVGIPLTNTFMLMIAYVFCNAWAKYLPSGGWLNPGTFNVKEHTCIYVIVSSANASAYATHILAAQSLYYNDVPGPVGSIFLLLATQMVGYGIAGQLRTFLVYPANMIWPTSLPTVSLLQTLNSKQDEARWRTRFFFIVFAATFIYEFIPQYMMPMLGGISILCLAKPESVWIQRLFGGLSVNEGLGMLQLSFDWNYLSNLSPLVLPLWVQMNIYVGIAVLWIIAPLIYYYDVWQAQSFPFLSNSIFQLLPNGTSTIYPQKYVLGKDNALNQTALEEVGMPYFPAVTALQYIFINFAVTASVAHIALFYGRDIWQNVKQAYQQRKIRLQNSGSSTENTEAANLAEDPHMQMMSFYKEVPTWWYYVVYFGGIGMNIAVAYANKSQLPWWAVVLAIVMSTILSLPLNMITAITGSGFGLNVFAEMICGFVLPGLPIANMYFKTLGYNTLNQAGNMASDLKIGHYLKVPPRAIFLNQMLGTFIGCIFNYIVNHSVVNSQRDVLLNPIGNNIWNGSSPQTINSAAITWGAIGPLNMFGPNSRYFIVLWAFLVGFLLPIPGWLLHRQFPKVGFKYINTPMILVGLTIVPGAATSWITVSFIIILTSQLYMKRYHRNWFVKYNYLISTALDSGTSLMVFIIAMALYGGVSGVNLPFPSWWGNRTDLKYMDQCCASCK
ncbi:OPT family small oligopeptide transporter [Mycotypha africana]|uniref:OPT family small oligopeptide transporter n=1 Tax=Mycotypha africana TaxID=64632 RepID=UPI0023005FF4|nr:OPT family small oligopeptide transporter [Mycotypha africana]KAI8979247.1 OPT family small oligopeptide transporter [Mycotypha africana]